MMYTVRITETIYRTLDVEVEAEDTKDAYLIARELLDNEEISMEDGDEQRSTDFEIR